ncbi:DUF58 domain-containing protein [Arhodomonas aquaeolei]|uniref:DUF58 domain-containing protein n=1 Tax=Arhodomonas aquaeolei TaxID=2369 RepID=UPI00036C1D2F|nr:DUF58 domain-containing protein [Arhodomonas aquaeolei]
MIDLPLWLRGWLRRRHGDTRARVTLHYRRIYILPTAQGWGFAALVVVMWLTATNYRLNLGFALTYLLVGIGVAAMHRSYRNLAGLTLEPGNPGALFAGGTARFPVTLINDTPRGRVAIALDAGDASVAEDVGPHDQTVVRVPRPAPRRGRLPAGRIRVATRHPGGLFQAWSWIEPDRSAVVYPLPEAHPPPLPAGRTGDGGTASDTSEEDYAGLRRYRIGDPLPRIAWKASESAGELHTKVFSGTRGAQRRLAWGDAPGLAPEARIARLAAWIEMAHARGEAYTLILPGCSLGPGHGERHRHDCLTALALLPL